MPDPDLRSVALGGIALLVCAASSAVVIGAPVAMRATLVLAALASVAAAAAVTRRRGVADAALVGTGGILVVLVTAGLVLGLSSAGLRPLTWALTLALIGLGIVLAVSGQRRRNRQRGSDQPADQPEQAAAERHPDRMVARRLVWAVSAVAGIGLVAAAFTVSIQATDASETPPIQMWLGSTDANSVQVVVASPGPAGPLELRAQTAAGAALSYPVIRIPDGGSVTTVIAVPRTGRVEITLNNVSQSAPLRSLILDRR